MRNILIISSLLFLAACGGGEETPANPESAGSTTVKEAPGKKLPLVSTFKAQEEVFNHYIELQGSVETDQNIVVYPEFQGKLIQFRMEMGDPVSKGQTVALIDDGGVRQQLAQLEEKAALSKITYERQKRLWDQKIGSELDFLRAETTYNADEEAVKQLKKQLEKATVVAPFTGIIDETLADEGQFVAPGQTPLFRIINLNDMYIQSDVPEAYLSSVKKGKKVLVELPVLDTIVETSVAKVSNYISPDNRTFKVEIDVPNPEGVIKPNLTARLKINDYTNEKAILIPQSIISENSEGKQYVYKTSTSGTATTVHKVIITTGKKQGDNIEVLSGLANNDDVVLEGARIVKDKQEVKIIK